MSLIKLLWLPVTIALSLLSLASRLIMSLIGFAFGHLIFLAIIIVVIVLLAR